MFFGYKRLVTPDDWRGLAGDDKWVPSRSAYELAHAWQAAGGLPTQIGQVLDRSGHDRLRGLNLDLCLVEKPVFLDTRRGPSMTDIMAYGHNHCGQAVVIAIEGKADESFDTRVCVWVRGGREGMSSSVPRPSRLRRLKFLAKHLGREVDTECTLRYQLLHRTVSAVIEAQLHGAAAALVLVHVFGVDAHDNWSDLVDFVRTVGGAAPVKGVVSGPHGLGELNDLSTYFLWWQDQ